MNLIVFNELNNKIKGTTPKKNKKIYVFGF